MKTKKKFEINRLTDEQAKVANPNNNVWVQANAGTGKTEVLNARILRILFRNDLYGTKHPGILCLTYTKVGASEMQKRILESLRHWVMADDENLKELLQDVTENTEPTDEDLQRARKIFYSYIDNQDVIKIRTIHSFCEEILHRFSLEAGLSPTFSLIEDVAQKQVLETTFEKLLSNVSNDESLKNAVDRILSIKSDDFLPELYKMLAEQYKTFFLIENIEHYRETFSNVLKDYLRLDEYKKIYEENKDKYSEEIALRTKMRDFSPVADIELQNIVNYLMNKDAYENTMAIFDIASKFATIYKDIKTEMNVIDFDDMILHTENLFSDPAEMGYVLSKLDESLGHILVDEAQDTSLHQWKIFKLISSEMIPDGEVRNEHSLFVVGDSKQSIFGFQGAAPAEFDHTKEATGTLLKNKSRILDIQPLTESFRSAAPILKFVDHCFDKLTKEDPLHNEPPIKFETAKHVCKFKTRKGIVEIHPIVPQQSSKKNPYNYGKKYYAKFLANEIAEKILKTPLDDGNGEVRECTPEDILILVRNRTSVINGLTIELKKKGIEVAGADAIKLTEFDAVIDLLNIIRFGINNKDDFSLCAVLKSPLYRWTDDGDISRICLEKEEKKSSVFEVLKNWAEQNSKYADIYNEIKDLSDQVASKAPYSFFSELLQKTDKETGLTYRQKFISAYGQQVIDPLEEFLSMCLSYERTQPGTLKNFLKWFITSEATIKRDFTGSKGVRIITVHKSKGLTTPVTMLIGTTDKIKDNEILNISETDDAFMKSYKELLDQYPNYKFWLWNPYKADFLKAKHEIASLYAKNRENAINEHYRLLYVALTRSKYGLYIYGYGNKQPDCWYKKLENMVIPSLSEELKEFKITTEDEVIRIKN